VTDFDRAMGKARSRLEMAEAQAAEGTWHPTPDTITALIRHTLGIVAALQAAIQPAATALRSS